MSFSTTWHSIFRPQVAPPEDIEPMSPVRDEETLGPDEDLDRQPDGIPHSVVGLTALFAIMLAILVFVIFLSNGMTGKILATLLVVCSIPIVVSKLGGKSERDRDHLHPSR
jgi:hypothetical protein